MADVQTENGFTRIANELLDAILIADLTKIELKIVLCVIRYTYGFKRKEWQLSIRFIQDKTRVAYQHVNTSVNRLVERNILIVDNQNIQTRQLKINKDYETWGCNRNSYTNRNGYSNQNSYTSVTETVTEVSPKRLQYKENFKENFKENRERERESENLQNFASNPRREKSINYLFLMSFGKQPSTLEYEYTQTQFIDVYGYDETFRLFREAALSNFKSIKTLKEKTILDENGKPQIKPREENGNGKSWTSNRKGEYEFNEDKERKRLAELKEMFG